MDIKQPTIKKCVFYINEHFDTIKNKDTIDISSPPFYIEENLFNLILNGVVIIKDNNRISEGEFIMKMKSTKRAVEYKLGGFENFRELVLGEDIHFDVISDSKLMPGSENVYLLDQFR
ncbi:hypothetical protein [Vibrio sp. HN007]|uniref:hypothetical protein n=1 Tax=Vibrio iocasae TaxID=3098914 RepID=UPI0035D42809